MQYDLSIIIPVYNAENTLVRCLNAILIQKSNYRIQIIFIDDGSTDNSLEILNNFQKKYSNVVVYSQKNEKQAQARNKGLSHANGKYIAFFDADDEIKSGMLGELLGVMKQGADMAMCGIEKKYTHSVVVENRTRLVGNNTRKNLLFNFLVHNRELDVGLWNKIYKLSIIKKNNLFFSNGNFFEDSLFNLKYLCCCNISKIEFISTPFYILNKGNNNTTRNFKPEIDNLALNYVVKAFQVLDRKNIKVPYKYKIGFEKRILIYVVHHHIKYDKGWSCEKQKKYCKSLRVKFSDFIGGSVLPLKYTIAYILIKNVPKIYSIIYSRYNL